MSFIPRPFWNPPNSILQYGGYSGWALLVVITFAGCGSHANPEPTSSSQAEANLPDLTAEVLEIQPQPWPAIVRVQGSLIADEISVIGTKVPGRVAEVHVELGDEVRAGQKLIMLDRTEFEIQIQQADAQLAQAFAVVGLQPGDNPANLNREKAPPAREAIAVWEKAKTELTRNRELFANKAITEVELEQSAMAERVAEAKYASTLNGISTSIAAISVRTAELSMARQHLADTVVVAPFDGIVQQRHVAPGTYVSLGHPMVTIVRTSRLRFRATLPERHVQRLGLGQTVRMHVESIKEPQLATITRFSPVLDEQSRSLMFEADVNNADRKIRPGLFAEAEVIVGPNEQAIVVDIDSVMEFAGVEKVWKVVDGKSTEQIVQTGQRRGHAVQIMSGLTAGEVILRDAKQGRIARITPRRTNAVVETALSKIETSADPEHSVSEEEGP